MAENDSTITLRGPGVEVSAPRPPGLPAEIQDEPYHRGWLFIGSRQALVEAGIAEPGWFPGEPGQRKTIGRASHQGRDICIFKRRGRYQVFVDRNRDEQKRHKQNEELQKAKKLEADVFALFPKSAADFRAKSICALEEALSAYKARSLSPRCTLGGGYGFTPEAIAEYEVAIAGAVEVLRYATVSFDAGHHARLTIAIRAETAKADAALQGLLLQAEGSCVGAEQP